MANDDVVIKIDNSNDNRVGTIVTYVTPTGNPLKNEESIESEPSVTQIYNSYDTMMDDVSYYG